MDTELKGRCYGGNIEYVVDGERTVAVIKAQKEND